MIVAVCTANVEGGTDKLNERPIPSFSLSLLCWRGDDGDGITTNQTDGQNFHISTDTSKLVALLAMVVDRFLYGGGFPKKRRVCYAFRTKYLISPD